MADARHFPLLFLPKKREEKRSLKACSSDGEGERDPFLPLLRFGVAPPAGPEVGIKSSLIYRPVPFPPPSGVTVWEGGQKRGGGDGWTPLGARDEEDGKEGHTILERKEEEEEEGGGTKKVPSYIKRARSKRLLCSRR